MGLVLNKFHFLLEQLEWKEVGEVGKIHSWEFWFLKKKSHFFPRFEPFGSSFSFLRSHFSKQFWIPSIPKVSPEHQEIRVVRKELKHHSPKKKIPKNPKNLRDWEIRGKNRLGDPWKNSRCVFSLESSEIHTFFFLEFHFFGFFFGWFAPSWIKKQNPMWVKSSKNSKWIFQDLREWCKLNFFFFFEEKKSNFWDGKQLEFELTQL